MGLEIIRHDIDIDFLGKRKIAYLFSAALILIGLVSLVVKGGPRFGIDFAGGLIVQTKFSAAVDPAKTQEALEALGISGVTVQRFGPVTDNTVLLRTQTEEGKSEEVRLRIEEALKKAMPGTSFEIQRVEAVGPKVGNDLKSRALEAIFYAVLLIAIYISGRFEGRWLAAAIMAAALAGAVSIMRSLGVPTAIMIVVAMSVTMLVCWVLKLKYALGAVLADLHDVFITVGVFSLLDKEFDLTIVAALLTILGYSLNDTIIVFDRIRENVRSGSKKSFATIINESINQTLSRTILTSGLTIIACLSLFFLGGAVIHDFALAMLIGILTGTYSSIFVASPIVLDLGGGLSGNAPQQARETNPATRTA